MLRVSSAPLSPPQPLRECPGGFGAGPFSPEEDNLAWVHAVDLRVGSGGGGLEGGRGSVPSSEVEGSGADGRSVFCWLAVALFFESIEDRHEPVNLWFECVDVGGLQPVEEKAPCEADELAVFDTAAPPFSGPTFWQLLLNPSLISIQSVLAVPLEGFRVSWFPAEVPNRLSARAGCTL